MSAQYTKTPRKPARKPNHKATTQPAGLGNPLATVVATQAASEATKVIPFVLRWVFVIGVGYVVYQNIFNKFKPIGFVSNYPIANISDAEAQNRADAIYAAMVGFGSNVNIVATNLAGLNYNGWIKVYNAFGERGGIISQYFPFTEELNLVEWINDQFNEDQIAQLRFILNNVF